MPEDRLLFESRNSFRKWLVKNHQASPGIWLVFGKGSRVNTLSANEALEEALCFGWIDGQIKGLGAEKYLKRFTPRRKGSAWSERNRQLATKLIATGTMTEAGHATITQAQESGTWDRPKPAPISDANIQTLIEALSGTGEALVNFLNMSPSVKRTYTALYLDAKADNTRKRRLEKIIGRLKENKKPM